MDVMGFDLPDVVPSFGIGSGNIWMYALILLILIIGSVVIWFAFNWKVYNRKIIVFENISGQGFQPTYRDRARLITLGDGGEEILYLKKRKVYRTAYGKKMGKNTYWFAVGQDGYWYNIVLGDVDAKMGMLDIEPIDRDMRYMHVAIRKNIAERYKKQKFMEKYGTIVMSGIFLLIMLIGIWLLLDKIADINSGVAESVRASAEVQQMTSKTLGSLDNICSGGSGIIQVDGG